MSVPTLVGLLLWVVVLAILPPTLVGVLLPAIVGVVAWLSRQKREQLAARVLAIASPMSTGQIALLEPTRVLLAASGVELGNLCVSRPSASGVLAEPFGVRTLLVSPRLVDAVARGTLDQETVAVVLAHAHARREASGGMRRDVAIRFIALPHRVLAAVARRVDRRLRWLPRASAFGLIGLVVVATAIERSFAQGTWWMGLTLMGASSIAVLGHVAPERWRRRIDAAADRRLAALGLDGALMGVLRAEGTVRSLDRLAALERTLQKDTRVGWRHLRLVKA